MYNNTFIRNIMKRAAFYFLACMMLVCMPMEAKYIRHGHYHHPSARRYAPVITVHHTSDKNPSLSPRTRYFTALNYLKRNEYITIKAYAKLTGLSKRLAETELDAFSLDKTKDIVSTVLKNKKVYILQKPK